MSLLLAFTTPPVAAPPAGPFIWSAPRPRRGVVRRGRVLATPPAPVAVVATFAPSAVFRRRVASWFRTRGFVTPTPPAAVVVPAPVFVSPVMARRRGAVMRRRGAMTSVPATPAVVPTPTYVGPMMARRRGATLRRKATAVATPARRPVVPTPPRRRARTVPPVHRPQPTVPPPRGRPPSPVRRLARRLPWRRPPHRASVVGASLPVVVGVVPIVGPLRTSRADGVRFTTAADARATRSGVVRLTAPADVVRRSAGPGVVRLSSRFGTERSTRARPSDL